MKPSKINLIICVLIFACAAVAQDTQTASANEAETPKLEAKKLPKLSAADKQALEQMKVSLDLTDEQLAKIEVILQKRAAARAENMKNQDIDRETRKRNMGWIDGSYKVQISEVLNDEQRERFEALSTSDKKRRDARMKNKQGWER